MKKLSKFGKAVEAVVKMLVENPNKVSVKETVGGEKAMIIHLDVDPEDAGKVIGKKGRMIKAIKTILFAGAKGKRVIFEFNPPKKEKKTE